MKTTLILLLFSFTFSYSFSQQLKYEIVKDDPSLGSIANLYISPQFAIEFPFFGRMDAKGDAVDAATLGIGFNVHGIAKEKYFFDAHYHRGTWFTGLTGYAAHRIDVGAAKLFSEKSEQKMMRVNLETKDRGTDLSGRKVVESKWINLTGTEYKYRSVRGGLYFQSMDFGGAFDEQKFRGVSNNYGVYAGISRGRVVNLEAKVGNYKHSKGVKNYGRLYADVILAPGGVNLTEGDQTESPTNFPFGFRAGWDRYVPSTGIFAGNWRMEVGYLPGFNGLYAQINLGFTIRSKLLFLNS